MLQADSLPAEAPGKPKDPGVGSLFPSPVDLPDPGIEQGSPTLQADSLPTELSGKSLDSGKQERLYCPFQNPFPPFDPFSTQHLLRQALRIPWTEEPGGLQSMELQRVGHH